MNQSENINELVVSLAKAQSEMQPAIKNRVNPFHKNSYADLGSVYEVSRPVLKENGLYIIQTTEFLPNEGKCTIIDDKKTTVVEGKTIMVTILMHSSGQWIKSCVPLDPVKHDSQGMGAAITYMRRYSLSTILGIVCDDDDDGETAVGRGKASSPQKKEIKKEVLSEQQVKGLTEILRSMEKTLREETIIWYKDHFKVATINDIPASAYVQCATVFTARLKEANMKAVV